MTLDERKSAILRAVVEEYIQTAQPVGSSHVARAGVGVSPATIRNEMAMLEREGYLVQPHTSAGRIPTDKGYRFFVDQLRAPGPLDPAQHQLVREFFDKAHGELEQMLHDTSRLLSRLTDYAAVVVGEAPESAVVRSAEVIRLAHRVGLVVLVLSNGGVERRGIELADEVDDDRLAAASTRLRAHLLGRALRDVPEVQPCGDAMTDGVVGAALHALVGAEQPEPEHVYVGGASRMAAAFDAVDTVRRVLDALEQQFVVVTLVRDVLDRGLSVAIGAEHGHAPLAECALVVSAIDVEGERAGTVGVLGPTRMNYPQALAAVGVVSRRLGRRLSEG